MLSGIKKTGRIKENGQLEKKRLSKKEWVLFLEENEQNKTWRKTKFKHAKNKSTYMLTLRSFLSIRTRNGNANVFRKEKSVVEAGFARDGRGTRHSRDKQESKEEMK